LSLFRPYVPILIILLNHTPENHLLVIFAFPLVNLKYLKLSSFTSKATFQIWYLLYVGSRSLELLIILFILSWLLVTPLLCPSIDSLRCISSQEGNLGSCNFYPILFFITTRLVDFWTIFYYVPLERLIISKGCKLLTFSDTSDSCLSILLIAKWLLFSYKPSNSSVFSLKTRELSPSLETLLTFPLNFSRNWFFWLSF